MRFIAGLLVVLCGLGLCTVAVQAKDEKSGATVKGYIKSIPPESAEDREARHKRVAERRAQSSIIMLHRGASKLAKENTLEAYNLTMDHGGDGNEIDLHRSSDGVIYLHHDGKKDKSYYEILKDSPEIPTLAALIVIIRERAMLLHLDVKQGGIDGDLIKMFDEADIWDHIIQVNQGNAEKVLLDDRCKQLAMRGWYDANWPDTDEQRKWWNEQPGIISFCKYDPRPAVAFLQREAGTAVAIPDTVYANWKSDGTCEPIKQ